MAFSLKWLLAGSAYAALAAAAALATGHWAFVDVLWIITYFAVVYAILGAFFALEKRRRGVCPRQRSAPRLPPTVSRQRAHGATRGVRGER